MLRLVCKCDAADEDDDDDVTDAADTVDVTPAVVVDEPDDERDNAGTTLL
jgi:hypothetical protein